MASPAKNKRAITTARCDCAVCGVTRIGFTPKDTRTVGSNGGFYVWSQIDGPSVLDPSTTWTQATGIGATPR